MSKVLFTTKYAIESEKLEEYKNIVDELRNLFTMKENVSLKIYSVKGKENTFQEIYEYATKEAWEEADEEVDERYESLMAKLSDMIVPKSTDISTLIEL